MMFIFDEQNSNSEEIICKCPVFEHKQVITRMGLLDKVANEMSDALFELLEVNEMKNDMHPTGSEFADRKVVIFARKMIGFKVFKVPCTATFPWK